MFIVLIHRPLLQHSPSYQSMWFQDNQLNYFTELLQLTDFDTSIFTLELLQRNKYYHMSFLWSNNDKTIWVPYNLLDIIDNICNVAKSNKEQPLCVWSSCKPPFQMAYLQIPNLNKIYLDLTSCGSTLK